MLRFDHVGVVFDDLDAAISFFLDLGFEQEGRTTVEGEAVDTVNGLAGVRAELAMVRTPDGTGRLELIKYHAPADTESSHPWPAPARWARIRTRTRSRCPSSRWRRTKDPPQP